jgi:MFS family permease
MNEARSKSYSVYILILLLFTLSLSHADRYLFSILIPAIKAEFGASDAVLGLIAGPGFMVSYLALALPVARLADRWSRRKTLAICAAVWSSATAACGLSTNVLQITLSRVMVGAGEAGAMPIAQSIVSSLFSDKRRASALGVISASTLIGALIGFGGGGVMAQLLGWRETFLALALAGFPLALLLWLTGPDRKKAAVVKQESVSSAREILRFCWESRALRFISIGGGLYNIFGYAAAIWVPSYFIRSHDLSVMETGIWLGFGSSGAGVLGAIASGFVVDRLRPYGQKWQLLVPAVTLGLSFPLTMMMLWVAGGSQVAGIPLVALFSVINGFFGSMWLGPSLAAISNLAAPKDRSQAAAVVLMTVGMIGSILGPAIAGVVSEYLAPQFGDESLRYALMAVSLFVLMAAIFYGLGGKYYAREIAVLERQSAEA